MRKTPLAWTSADDSADAAVQAHCELIANLIAFILVGISAVILGLSLNVTQVAKTVPGDAIPCAAVSLVFNGTACNHSSPCVKGFLDTDIDQCVYHPATTETECTSACYVDTQPFCNGKGKCVGATCVGTCDSDTDCPSIFGDLDSVYDPSTFWTYSSFYSVNECHFGKCVYLVLDIYATIGTRPIFSSGIQPRWRAGASRFSCLDYIQPAVREARKECLTSSRALLADDMVDHDEFLNYGNASFPFQTSFCTIAYTCAPANVSLFIASTADGGAGDIPLKSMEEWGFLPLSNGGAGDQPFLDIDDPFVRNAFAAKTRATIVSVFPAFVQHVMTLFNGTLA